MPNSNYLRGRRLEYRVMARLRGDGYEVFRTAGSHGKVDVIAVDSHLTRFIQCKRFKTRRSLKVLLAFVNRAGAHFDVPARSSLETWVWTDQERTWHYFRWSGLKWECGVPAGVPLFVSRRVAHG